MLIIMFFNAIFCSYNTSTTSYFFNSPRIKMRVYERGSFEYTVMDLRNGPTR